MAKDTLPPEVRERTRARYWYRKANIPEHLWSIDWEKFEGQPTERASDAAFDLADGWVNDEGGYRGLAIFGDPGVGKTTVLATMLCSLIRATIPTTIQGLFAEDVQGYFTTLADYHRLYLRSYELDRWATRRDGDASDLVDEWEENFSLRRFIETEVPHLVLDDVGKEHVTGSRAAEDEFHSLIRGRYARGLSTSITSNLHEKGFAKAYGPAQLSFIQEACLVFHVEGTDMRVS